MLLAYHREEVEADRRILREKQGNAKAAAGTSENHNSEEEEEKGGGQKVRWIVLLGEDARNASESSGVPAGS